ncbi:MAG TPA: hypothetical protein VHQ90_14990 [Thermoanaerobaculia bacterium]|nr:hypothetical protein [Thermoanaerobaculia bacterium]
MGLTANGWSALDVLPGLYFLLLAGVLAAVLGRWYDALPRWALLVFLGLPLALFFRALFCGGVQLPLEVLRMHIPFRELPPEGTHSVFLQRDLVHQIAPWALEVKRALRAGRWPLWNRYVGAGMPLMADPQAQAFQPLVLAVYPLTLWSGWAVTGALKVWLALVFTFLLLRRQGLAEAAALGGAVAYGLGNFLLLWLGWPMANGAALLPVALYAVVRCDVAGGRRDWLLLTLTLAALLLAGHPEIMAYVIGFAGLFLLDRARCRERGRGGLIARGALALGIATALASPVLLLARAYLPTTLRAAAVRQLLAPRPVAELWHQLLLPQTLMEWRQEAAGRLLPIAAPRALGDQYSAYWGSGNFIEHAGSFVGTASLLLVLVALLPRKKLTCLERVGASPSPPATAGQGPGGSGEPGRGSAGVAGGDPKDGRRPQERLLLAALGASLLLLIGPPGLENLEARLPLLGVLAVHRNLRIQVLIAFCLAYLAACQLDRWLCGERRRGGVAGAAIVLAGVLAWGYLGHVNAGTTWREDSVHLSWMWLGGAVLAASATLLLLAGTSRAPGAAGSRVARAAPWLLCALIGGELFYGNFSANPPSGKRLAFPLTPPIRFLMRHLGDARIVGLGRAFSANFPEVYRLADVRIDNPSMPYAYELATESLKSRRFALEPFFIHPESPLYDLFGVRYVLSFAGAPLPFPAVLRDPAGWVFERPHALPRLFLPSRTEVSRGSAMWTAWLAGNDDFARRALAEPSPAVSREWHAELPDSSALSLAAMHGPGSEPERISARARLVEPRLLAASIDQDGAWHVLAGGERHPTVLVDGLLVGAWLPAGDQRVELIYRPAPFIAGCVLAALGLAAAVAWCSPAPVRFPEREPRERAGG